ncbi:MAG TPA: gliding motility-associated C-terminal domain-containing protein [Bacteroidales bacterium]|nr:gliding motility-associated C-terminal domain-containing protein [Bacteroidales bacterium]HQI45717.1 gliding motility-associated C-terminal domain-containing protein [Bacteroidales bacterium]
MKKIIFTFLLCYFSAFIYAQSYTASIEVNGTPSDSAQLCGLDDYVSLSVNVTGGVAPYQYAWTGDAGQLSSNNTQVTIFTSTTLGSFNVKCTITDNLGAIIVDSILVNINSLPNIFVPLDQKLCLGDCVDLTCSSTNADGFIWYEGNVGGTIIADGPGTTPLTVSVCPTNNTDYWALSYNALTGCTRTKKVTVRIVDLSAVATANPNPTCNGETTQLTVTPTGGDAPYTYSWSPNTEISSTTIANPTAWPSSTTTYCVTVTDKNHCTATSCVVVTVSPPPTIDKDTTICNSGCATLVVNPTGPAPHTYSWSTSETTQSINPCPTITTVYTVTVVDGNACTTTASATVTVSPPIIVDAGLTDTICYGESITIGGSPTASGGVAPYTYDWNSNPSGFTSDVSNPSVSPIVNTHYFVTVTDAAGCIEIDSVIIVVNPMIIADAGNDTIVCTGTSMQIGGNPTASGGTPPYTYSWSPASGLDDTDIPNPIATFTTTTTYTVTVTDSLGCTATDNVTLTVSAPITATIDVTIPTSCTACDGAMTVNASGGTPAYTYSWTTTPPQTTQTITDLCAGMYSVIITDANACSTQADAVINGNTDVITLTVSPNDTICAGECVTFTANSTITYDIYDFLVNNDTVQSGPLNTLDTCGLVSGDQIMVIGTDLTTNCINFSNEITMIVGALPLSFDVLGGDTICSNDSTLISLSGSQIGISYSLILNGTPPAVAIEMGTGLAFNFGYFSAPGIYKVIATDTATGCSKLMNDSAVIVLHLMPHPTITGPNNVCEGTANNIYVTEAGMSNYSWTVSAGGVITSLPLNNDSVTVTWNTPGPQTISVTVFNNLGCDSTTIFNVLVDTVYIPTITGNDTVCLGTTNNIYVTEPGMTNYIWHIPTGGVITSLPLDNDSITVTWNDEGSHTVNVIYTNTFGCTADTSTYNVFVATLPVPTIIGSDSACLNKTISYTTEPGMSDYIWTIPPTEGTIISSPLDSNAIAVIWNTLGNKTVSVNYKNIFGCEANVATTKNIEVFPLPAPTISGSDSLCVGTIGSKYTTIAGMLNYVWTVTGGTITSTPLNNDTITVTWDTAGTQTITLTATNIFGCDSTVTYTVEVKPLPTPSIIGSEIACIGSVGNMYYTQPGMTNYVWTVSAGGIITSLPLDNDTIYVTWNTAGTDTVFVNYTNEFGCTAVTPFIHIVSVSPLPIPSITGPANTCIGELNNVYTTQTGMTNYVWTVSAGGTITSGGTPTSNTVTITWNTLGAQSVSVNYTNSFGCTGETATVYNIIVNSLPVSFNVTGGGSFCAGGVGVPVGLSGSEAGASYQLLINGIPSGSAVTGTGMPISFGNQTQAGIYTVEATYTSSQCSNTMAGLAMVVVNSVTAVITPVAPSICAGETLILTASGGNSYFWSGSLGTTSSITVNPNVTTSYSVTVTNTITGCSDAESVTVTVKPVNADILIPSTPLCLGDTVQLTAIGGGTYTWNTTPAQTTAQINVVPVSTTTYCVTVNATNGCSAVVCEEVVINTLPTVTLNAVNTESCFSCDGSISVVNTGVPVSTYSWSNGFNTATIYNLCPAVYTLTVTSEMGCKAVVSAPVLAGTSDAELGIVNTFSPNGDGVNDTWVITNLDLYLDNELVVLNRWGNEVYSMTGYKNNWDGSNLREGTYFYFLTVEMCTEKKTFKGYITIVR